MKFRWTIKELKEKSDDEIIKGILAERLSDLNGYCPLAQRLNQIYRKIETRLLNKS